MYLVMLGIGGGSLAAGMIVASALVDRLGPRLQALGPGVITLLVSTLISRLWVLGMLPLTCYLCARIFDLRPWRDALLAGLSGDAVLLVLAYITVGTEGLAQQWPQLVLQAMTLALGVALSRRAILRGRAAAGRAEEAARKKAEVNKSQYDEFLREAERVASLRDKAPETPAGAPAPVAEPSTRLAAETPAAEASAQPTAERATGSDER